MVAEGQELTAENILTLLTFQKGVVVLIEGVVWNGEAS
jgi:hypothetical protein